ncbi:MAG: hypothetical protein LBU82_01615 [Treponema sp.]|jgi:hypothetical protein|nr:hypothetical protein [Treponema sp.]
MKKIIALLVVFALFAGSAFAADLSASAATRAKLLIGSSKEDSDITTAFDLQNARVQGGADSDDGVMGGWIRMDRQDSWNAYVYWKPLDFLRIRYSYNPDGHWGANGPASGWGFYEQATDYTDEGANAWGEGGLYGWNGNDGLAFGTGATKNVMIDIMPIDILTVHVGLPVGSAKDKDGKSTWGAVFQEVYTDVDLGLPFGRFIVAYKGQGEKKGQINASIGLPIAILDLCIGAGIPFDTTDGTAKKQISAGVNLKASISDVFGIKLRTYTYLGGEDTDPFTLTADVLPYFKVTDNFTAYLSVGFGMGVPKEGDTLIGFNLNPYVQVTAGGGRFFAGFKLTNNGVKYDGNKTETTWGVTTGMTYDF